MSIFDKYLVNKPLHAETDSGAIPAAFYSEDFTVSLGDFTTSGEALWTRVTNEGNGDLFSAMSGNIADKQVSILELVKVTTQESTYLKFDYKTSTEGNYDYLMIIVNDVIAKRYSGTNAWTTDSVFIHGIGSQTIKFVYWKDNSSDGGSDTVWIDNVSLHNYEESAISNTSTLFNEDVTVNGDFVHKNGEASFAEINSTGRINAFNPTNKRYFRLNPDAAGGSLSFWNAGGLRSINMSTSNTATGLTFQNPTAGGDKVVMGANTVQTGGFMQFPDTAALIRLGESVGSDTDKILVVNGESIFRGQIDMEGASLVQNNSAGEHGSILYPEGGFYSTITNDHTGAIKIRLPLAAAGGVADMLSFEVNIYDYIDNECVKLLISGYNYQAIGGTEWTNGTAQVLSATTGKDYYVRFGSDGTRKCIWIGETASTWNYLQVQIMNFTCSFAANVTNYETGWEVVPDQTAFGSVTKTIKSELYATDTLKLGGLTSSQFLRSDVADTFSGGTLSIDDGTGVGGNTNIISFAGDRGWIGYNAGNLKVQASSGKGIRWSTDTLTFATAGEDMYLYQGRLGVGDYATAQQAQLTVTDYTAGTNNVAFFKGQAITEGDATTISINNGYSAEYRKEVKIGAVAESGSSNLTGMALYTSPNSSGSFERVRIDSAGNVGIGTTDPQAKLHVAEGTLRTWSPTLGTSAIFESTASNRNFVTLTAVNEAELWFGDATTQSKGRVRYEMANDNMEFWTAQAQKMVLDSSGNLGIGTTSPNYKLEVFGTGNFTNILRISSGDQATARVNIRNANSTGARTFSIVGGINAVGQNGLSIYDDVAAATRFVIDNDGNVGIGTNTPDGKVHIDGITSTLPGIVLEVAENSAFNKIIEIQNTSASKRFGIEYDNVSIRLGITDRSGSIIMSFVEGTKYVGIGKTNPSFPLDVVGEIHATTYVSATDGFGIDSTSMGSGRGIALYGGPQLYPQYGLLFATTADLGTHGSVTSDFATYFTMNSTSTRGWVFKAGTVNSTAGNVASINATGAMTLNSTATATNFILSSDKRLKKNIKDVDYDNHVKVDWKTFELKNNAQKRYGVIAQELEEHHPEFVRTDDEGMKSVAYIDLLIAKIAELEARLEKAGI